MDDGGSAAWEEMIWIERDLARASSAPFRLRLIPGLMSLG